MKVCFKRVSPLLNKFIRCLWQLIIIRFGWRNCNHHNHRHVTYIHLFTLFPKLFLSYYVESAKLSVNVANVVPLVTGKSNISNRDKTGSRMLLCGTPDWKK